MSKFLAPISPAQVPVAQLPLATNHDGGVILCPDYRTGSKAYLQSIEGNWRPLLVKPNSDPVWVPANFRDHPDLYWGFVSNAISPSELPISNSGAGTGVTKGLINNYVELPTGSTATGRSAWGLTNGVDLTNDRKFYFRAEVRVPEPSTVAESFTDRVGFLNFVSAESTFGLFFRYSHAFGSGNWIAISANGSGLSTFATSVAPDIANFQVLEIIAASNKVEWKINGTVVRTITSDIPVDGMGACFYRQKAAGTTSRAMRVRSVKVVGERI